MKVRGDGEEEEEFDPEQYKRDCEAEIQQYLDVVGRDSPEGKAILRDLEAGATPPRPTKADPEETQLIDLRLLVDSRIYRRHAPSSEELTALARSIKANGLKNPVEVRLVEGKFEIICGHRRVAAYRMLFDAAQTDDERARYQAIRAKVRPDASDLDVIRQGIAEDLLREEFSAGDVTRCLQVLRELDPQLDSPEKLSEATGLAVKRVARQLQLGKASAVVQDAAWEGVRVNIEGQDEGTYEERRKLDLFVALEFSRLHAALSNKKAAKQKRENGERGEPSTDGGETTSGDDHDESSASEGKESAADQATRKAIERALTEGWSYREVKRHVDKAIEALNGPKPRKVGRPRVAFKWRKQRLQVDVARLDSLDASQKAELRKVIEEILRKL
jgi:ParB-like chromosome segregation protein Spo0J